MPDEAGISLVAPHGLVVLVRNAANARPDSHIDEVTHLVAQVKALFHQSQQVNVIADEHRHLQLLFQFAFQRYVVPAMDALNVHGNAVDAVDHAGDSHPRAIQQ